MIYNVNLSDTVILVSLPSDRLFKLLQFYVNTVDLFGRVNWVMSLYRLKSDLKSHFIDFSEYSCLLCALVDLCNFDSVYPIVF